MANAPKEMTARDLGARAISGISRGNVRIVQGNLRARDAPLRFRGPATVPQKPRGVRIFETIDGVTKTDIVFPLQVRKFVIVVTSGRAIRQNFVEVSVGVVLKERVA